jgi:transposase
MLGLPSAVRILVFSEPADMRKGYDGLSALVMAAGERLYSGHLFVFLSRRRDRAKILTHQKGGLVLWCKRLDRGTFKLQVPQGVDRLELDATELAMLIDGIDFARVRRPVHWKPAAA